MTKQNKNTETDWSPGDSETTYVVVRHTYGVDHRVSDKTYSTPNDPSAVEECERWKRIVESHPDGTKVAIVKFDKKKHKTW